MKMAWVLIGGSVVFGGVYMLYEYIKSNGWLDILIFSFIGFCLLLLGSLTLTLVRHEHG